MEAETDAFDSVRGDDGGNNRSVPVESKGIKEFHTHLFLFDRALLHKHLGRLVVRHEPQHAYRWLLIFIFEIL